MPAFPGIAVDEVVDWAASYTGSVMLKGTGTAYTFTGTSSTGISDADYPGLTTRGLQYLDGTFYVMEPDGTIANSNPAADDPTDWPTDGFINAQFEPDSGVFLGKALNYIVAFGQWTTELFWNAGNATGSPLSPVSNGVLLVGCAAANSVAQTESTLIWMAQRKAQNSSSHKGRFVAMLVGTSYEELSTPDVCRVLEEDDLTLVRACVMEIAGHSWYALTLGSLGITLVFDMKVKQWYVWTRLAAGTPQVMQGVSQVRGLATGTVTSGISFSDGDPAVIAGVTPDGYNGTFNMSVGTSPTQFTYPVSTSLAGTGTTTTTMLVTPYTEDSFAIIASIGYNEEQVVMDLTGNVYLLDLGSALDDGSIPINWRVRTKNLDEGNDNRKFAHAVTLAGDVATVETTGLLRCSDDDYQTWGYFRRFDLSQVRCQGQRWGHYIRRAWEFRYTGNLRWRLRALDVGLTQGVT